MEPMIEAGMVEMNLGFYGYVGLGILYNLQLSAGAYTIFKKKNYLSI